MKAAVVTISDTCFADPSRDRSGPALKRILTGRGWACTPHRVPDEIGPIAALVSKLSNDPQHDLVVTTGGTGIAPRDVTPEAIRPLLEKEIPGLAEQMRRQGQQQTELAALSRSLAGVRQGTLILCFPGSVKGAIQSLQSVLPALDHAVALLRGRTDHPPSPD